MRVRPEGYQPPTSTVDLLTRYAAGERYFEEMDLPDGTSLRGVVLANANLSNSFLFEADFSDADLRGAMIENCNLKCSCFQNANLENASLRNSSVEATEWDGAILVGTSFEGCGCYGYTLKKDERP